MLAISTALTTSVIAFSRDLPSPAMSLWIFSQSFLAILPGMLTWCLLQRWQAKTAQRIGSLLIFFVPIVMIFDAMVYHWIGQRLFSHSLWRVTTELRDSLAPHVGTGTVLAVASRLGLACVLVTAIWFASKAIAVRWRDQFRPKHVFAAFTAIALLAAIPAAFQLDETIQVMATNSTQHPLCVFRVGPFRNLGTTSVLNENREGKEKLIGKSLEQAIAAREMRIRTLNIEPAESRKKDIVIVVVESFRRELVDPVGMPTLWGLSQRSLYCTNHFSGGNATNHGMFSLFNGLEAIWFDRPVRFTPLLNRLFQSAGYEIGFFAGHDQWRDFYMDGFIDEAKFDEFKSIARKGLDSDRMATQQASAFLNEESATGSERAPRLAVLYLYGTHATFDSYAQDQIFQPAADDRFLYPYDASARESVWNRYRNSARTADRFLSAVATDERIVLVTGDHGEAFLEDGTIGHGVRISAVQNMTPAVLYVPDQPPRLLKANTSHIDLLPTLIAAAGLKLTDPKALDGENLLEASRKTLGERVFATRNYLEPDVALIGPWTQDTNLPFAYRMNVSLRKMQVDSLDAIDKHGKETPSQEPEQHEAATQWLNERFPSPASRGGPPHPLPRPTLPQAGG